MTPNNRWTVETAEGPATVRYIAPPGRGENAPGGVYVWELWDDHAGPFTSRAAATADVLACFGPPGASE